MKKEVVIGLVFIISIMVIGFASAGMFDWFKSKITGEATSAVFKLNITVAGGSAPIVKMVQIASGGHSPIGGDVYYIDFNVSVYDEEGYGNINDASLNTNFTRLSGEAVRTNTSCTRTAQWASKWANYTCRIGLWYYDGPGEWNVTAFIQDINGNGPGIANSTNRSNFTYTQMNEINVTPTWLNFSTVNPGAYNSTPTTNLTINNRGNQNISSDLQVNATNLYGEITSAIGIYAGNMSVSNVSGTPLAGACNWTNSNVTTYKVPSNISNTRLPRGNNSVADLGTGKETMDFCIRYIGSELTAQAYSTYLDGQWQIWTA